MQRPQAGPALMGGTVLAALVFIWSALPGVSRAQTPSDLDTMRIVDVTNLAAGDAFDLDLYLRNVDTLGAYTLRMRFDPAVLTPAMDTSVKGTDTVIELAAVEQMRGTAFETFAVGAPELGVLTFLALDLEMDPADLFLPGGGVAARMTWLVKPTATAQTTGIAFENDPIFPSSFNTITDIRTTVFKRPVLTDGAVTITEGCACPSLGDPNGNTISWDIGDAVHLTNVIFYGEQLRADPDPMCPNLPGDVDCNGVHNALDVLTMLYIITGDFQLNAICDPCTP